MPDDVTQVHKLADLTPSETLRAAAARLRAMAEMATLGPWHFDDSDADFQPCVKGRPAGEWVAECGPVDSVAAPGGRGDHDAHWIAVMSPVVAEPLARELEMHAGWLRTIEDLDGDRASMGHALAVERAEHMLAFARSILEQP